MAMQINFFLWSVEAEAKVKVVVVEFMVERVEAHILTVLFKKIGVSEGFAV
jgi:hypothetical protein